MKAKQVYKTNYFCFYEAVFSLYLWMRYYESIHLKWKYFKFRSKTDNLQIEIAKY